MRPKLVTLGCMSALPNYWKYSVQSEHFKMSHEGHIKPKYKVNYYYYYFNCKNVIQNDGLTDYLIIYVQILY